jgi:transglutaminase/protease-like cytokinesis protein 3
LGGEKKLTDKIIQLTDQKYFEFAGRVYSTKVSINHLKRQFTIDIDHAYEETNTYVKEVANEIKKKTGADKKLYIRKATKYIYDQFEYDAKDINRGNTAKAFITKKAICEIYSDIFFRLMREANIPVRIVVNSSHAWNMVKLDDSWYHIDITYMVRDNDISKHFCLTTDKILKTRDYDTSLYPVN